MCCELATNIVSGTGMIDDDVAGFDDNYCLLMLLFQLL